jgi:hypothetical protein
MKKSILFLTCVSVLMFSCNSDGGERTELDSQTELIEELDELGLVTPFMINDVEGGAIVGFIESARPFFLDVVGLTDGKEHLDVLKNAIKHDHPLKVYLFSGTNNIHSIGNATDDELQKYEESKVAPPKTKSTAPVIPSETVLNQILTAINNSGINFSYAVDGCYYRAHAMRRIIVNYGYDCNKLWL